MGKKEDLRIVLFVVNKKKNGRYWERTQISHKKKNGGLGSGKTLIFGHLHSWQMKKEKEKVEGTQTPHQKHRRTQALKYMKKV